MSKTILRFRSRSGQNIWVAGVSWKKNDRVAVTWTSDREKAARMSTATAHQIGVKFYTSPVVLELCDGTVLESDTRYLMTEQHKKCQIVAEDRLAYTLGMRKIFDSMPEALKASITNLMKLR